LIAAIENMTAAIAIGGVTVQVNASDAEFIRMLEERYVGFVGGGQAPDYEFDVVLTPPGNIDPDADVRVFRHDGKWRFERGDFRAEWDPASRRGRIRQSANPYSIDAVLRIVHSLVLAQQGGLLVHAASAVRNGRAFLFAGVSGAGKTTMSRLAPPDATLLTDEISYLRRDGDGYMAYGTPFAGELAKPGENVRAPLGALYLLAKGDANSIEPVGAAEAARALLESILFFAHDSELVGRVFESACELVSRVPVYRLTFFPDARVWELIQ
jgi:hypothetical protein